MVSLFDFLELNDSTVRQAIFAAHKQRMQIQLRPLVESFSVSFSLNNTRRRTLQLRRWVE